MGGANDTSAEARSHPAGRNLEPINLAAQAPIRLGALTVKPALRQVVHDGGRDEILQPRVMQVLVALIRADGQILTRDDLVASCWRGVVVGEDAITRVIGSLRRLSERIGADVFKLETITRVGYRLVCSQAVADARPAARTSESILPTEPLLAVLAFDNLCEGDDMAWFTDGVSEEVLQTVARCAGVAVIGRGSSFQFRGAAKAASNVAAELNATHILDGSVRRSGSHLRIAAHLIACASQTTLWSSRFDRELADVFAVQDDIASAVAAALQTTFFPSPVRVIDPQVYDLYLRAQGTVSDDRETEMTLLEKVTTLAPEFAPAWAALAHLRAVQGRYGSPQTFSASARARVVDEAGRALQLDPRSGLAFAALSTVEPYGLYDSRESLLLRALAGAPSDAVLLGFVAGFCGSVGRFKDALGYGETAYQVDPLSPLGAEWYANGMLEAGDLEKTLAIFEKARSRWPDVEWFTAVPLQQCAFLGKWTAFDAVAQTVQQSVSPSPGVREALFVGRALRDPNPEIRARVLKSARDELDRSGTIMLGLVVFAYKLGLHDEVFDLIEQASFQHVFDPGSPAPGGRYNASVIFSVITELRCESRFVRLCAKLGLCDYWVKTDRWPDCADERGALPYDFKSECRRLTVANT